MRAVAQPAMEKNQIGGVAFFVALFDKKPSLSTQPRRLDFSGGGGCMAL